MVWLIFGAIMAGSTIVLGLVVFSGRHAVRSLQLSVQRLERLDPDTDSLHQKLMVTRGQIARLRRCLTLYDIN